MAVDIAEIDEPGAPGLLRTKWFPMVRSEPACFEVVMLLSAFNMVSLNKHTGMASILLQLKASAIDRINDDLARGLGNSKSLCDGTIGAVAKMASFEAMHGDQRSYAVHMAGLKRMIELRGGLDCLGLDGLLRRIVIWIDVNSSFLLNTSRYFPGEHFTTSEVAIEPNPAAFIAA